MKVLLRTVSGSHMYGLAHAGSDLDYYEVIADNPGLRRSFSEQVIKVGIDTTRVSLSTFLRHVEAGVPQACEVMMCREPELDLIGHYRAAFRFRSPQFARYMRTIKSHAYVDVGTPEHIRKRKRHALRYGWNLKEMRETGRFNPRLTPHLARLFTNVVDVSRGDPDFIYMTALRFAGFEPYEENNAQDPEGDARPAGQREDHVREALAG